MAQKPSAARGEATRQKLLDATERLIGRNGYIVADRSYRHILVAGAYGMSEYLDMEDYKLAALFADGALSPHWRVAFQSNNL